MRGHGAATNEWGLFATTRQPHARNRLICGGSDLAVIDSDHRFRARKHQGDVIQAVTALQVHDLGRVV